ncbi:hypothetical protein Godav_015135 [Gossypium davidsonii]|uniref:Uncharacterized protein n=2 Tax=Gossypium TaxID=3633 RepID=A0A7J8RM54_GOSDV|nr:hypothetical protein [Gossypium davidsonii]MBA0650136.1 hypothetical protein [Gossypium klotzschianum]
MLCWLHVWSTCNVRTFNADMRFKADYLNELERMLEKV